VLRVTVTRHAGRARTALALWLWWQGPGEPNLDLLWRAYLQRYDIENRVHYGRDVTFAEDARQARVGDTPHAAATLRNLPLAVLRAHGRANIADAVRRYGADAHRARPLRGLRPPRL